MITEQQVREVFALIEATRARWCKEVGGYGDELVKIDGDELVFIDSYTDSSDTETMPLAALFDFDGAAAVLKEEKRKREEAWEAQRKERRRRDFEAMKREFGE